MEENFTKKEKKIEQEKEDMLKVKNKELED
jgi:hypothetical protein